MTVFNQALPIGTKVRLYTLEEAMNLGLLVESVLRFSHDEFVHYFYYDENYKNVVVQRHIDHFLGQELTVDSRDLKPPHLNSDPDTHYYRFKNEHGDTAILFVCLVKEVIAG